MVFLILSQMFVVDLAINNAMSVREMKKFGIKISYPAVQQVQMSVPIVKKHKNGMQLQSYAVAKPL